jgi:hypothetical protein
VRVLAGACSGRRPLTLSLTRAQIIQVNLTSEDFRPIAPGAEVEFTYSVRWAPTATPFARRFERYLDYNFFEHQARGAGGASAVIGAQAASGILVIYGCSHGWTALCLWTTH